MRRNANQAARNGQQGGYVVLLAVLVIGAVGLAVALVLLAGVTDGQRTSLAVQRSVQARQLADACAEEALMQIQLSASFTGSGNVALGKGTCTYTVANPSATVRTVTASGTVDGVTSKLQLSATIGATISITSWADMP